jgi:type IV pilus assembly protein PilV
MNKVPSKNYGFSLLEVLISLVIMSVGMMGLAGLKMVAVKGANESHFRHEASLLMMDLADSMRANLEAVDAGNYLNTTAVSLTSPPTLCESTTACTSTQLAAYDKYRVARRLSRSVVGSTLTITCSKTTPATDCTTAGNPSGFRQEHTIKITWKVRKDRTEDLTLDNDQNDHENHIRYVELDVTP